MKILLRSGGAFGGHFGAPNDQLSTKLTTLQEISFNACHAMRKFFLILIMLTNVSDEDLAAAVNAKEIDLNCILKPWEVTLLTVGEKFIVLSKLLFFESPFRMINVGI